MISPRVYTVGTVERSIINSGVSNTTGISVVLRVYQLFILFYLFGF